MKRMPESLREIDDFAFARCFKLSSVALPAEFTRIYHHVLCLVVSRVSYVVFERHIIVVWLPVAVTFLYGLVMLYLNWIREVDGPCPFFRIHQQSARATVL